MARCHTRRGQSLPILLGLLLWGSGGCTRSGPSEIAPDLVTVTGIVTHQGQPVAGARVGFHPLKSGADEVDFAHGVADSHGRYSLAMPEHGPGAIPGEYVVTVTHPEGGLPSRYKSEDSSPLRVTVPDQETNDVPLELTD